MKDKIFLYDLIFVKIIRLEKRNNLNRNNDDYNYDADYNNNNNDDNDNDNCIQDS